jgi:hypothetical protein
VAVRFGDLGELVVRGVLLHGRIRLVCVCVCVCVVCVCVLWVGVVGGCG